MFTTKPYLIRAIHEWCVDEGFTPYLAVQVDERTRVPREFVRDGQIVLNVSAEATHQLVMGNEEISFQTRFNGASFPVVVPVDAVVAIYARENGQGMAFEAIPAAASAAGEDEKVGAGETALAEETESAGATVSEVEPTAKRGGHLTLIK
ncbi:MAG: ClpXP protease specificity-enhancing factor [Pseudomonadota bacterium]